MTLIDEKQKQNVQLTTGSSVTNDLGQYMSTSNPLDSLEDNPGNQVFDQKIVVIVVPNKETEGK